MKLRIIDQYKQEWFSEISNTLIYNGLNTNYLKIQVTRDLELPLFKYFSRNVHLPGVPYYPQHVVITLDCSYVGVRNQMKFTIFYHANSFLPKDNS